MSFHSNAPVAIIVVNYGSHALIEKNLAEFRHDPARPVIVVDNYSSEGERATVSEVCAAAGWHLVASADNGGFGRGCNLGARRARELNASSLVFLNPDATMTASVVDELAALVMEDRKLMVSPRIVDSSGAVVFDDVPAALTDDVARDLYGLEANEVLERDDAPAPASALAAMA